MGIKGKKERIQRCQHDISGLDFIKQLRNI